MPATLNNWLNNPRPNLHDPNAVVPASQGGIVMPSQLPPSSMVFPTAWDNKMLNIPGQNVFQLYHGPRSAYAAGVVGQR